MQGQDSERIPLRQATDDGFVHCPLCEPGPSPTGQLHIDCSAVHDQSTRS